MSPVTVLAWVAAYFVALLGLSWWTGRDADAAGYFLGNRRSPWLLVALGLIGDSLSGVSYLSVPGKVARDQFGYLQVVVGYVAGYAVIAHVLLPLYYRLELTSIYGFLGRRFDTIAERTGSAFFLGSRLLGSAARLYLSVQVFQAFVFEPLGVPFAVTATAVILLILGYTVRGGIKTLVWTDTFQSAFLVLGIVLSAVWIARELDLGPAAAWRTVFDGPSSRVWNWDWRAPGYAWKQVFSGAAIAVVMTGLDQNNMQKTLSCRSLRDAQRNLHVFVPIMVVVHVAILGLGALLFEFARQRGIEVPAATDELFPKIALHHLGGAAAVVFVLGLTAATFNSADSVLTTLTTSFCVDFLRMDTRSDWDEARRTRLRRWIHVGFAGALLVTVLIVARLPKGTAVIDLVLNAAGYTYGPLLGLFAVGLFTGVRVGGPRVPLVCIAAVAIGTVLEANSKHWFGGYQFGFERLLMNAALTAAGLLVLARTAPQPATSAGT
jgi:Na+/proline symporter